MSQHPTAWEIVYRMTKDHDGNHEEALARIKEFAEDMMEVKSIKGQPLKRPPPPPPPGPRNIRGFRGD